MVWGIKNKGEKSEVQGDLQIPSSLALALPPTLSFSLILVQFSQPFFHFSENRMEKYMYKVYMCIRTCTYMCIRSLSWRDCAQQKDAFPLSRILKEPDRFMRIDSILFR